MALKFPTSKVSRSGPGTTIVESNQQSRETARWLSQLATQITESAEQPQASKQLRGLKMKFLNEIERQMSLWPEVNK